MTRKLIGLTGGIGSGKSTVARLLADRGVYIVDADAIAREIVAKGSSGLAALIEAFGTSILQPGGDLDRAALAAVAFRDPGAKAKLDSITHPLIAARTGELFAAAPEGSPVVHDVALLTELGLESRYEFVIVVVAPVELRVARLIDRGLTEADARARIAVQATDDQREAIADAILHNDASKSDLEAQVDALWPHIAAL